MGTGARLTAAEDELAQAKDALGYMAVIVTHARSTTDHVVQSPLVKAPKALHAEINRSPGRADTSG